MIIRALILFALLISIGIGCRYAYGYYEFRDVNRLVEKAKQADWHVWAQTRKRSWETWIPDAVPVPSYDGKNKIDPPGWNDFEN